MGEIERHGSGGAWEDVVGYSRVVRMGDLVFLAGTTATMPDGAIAGLGDPYAQTVQAIDNIASALARIGATLADVVRTRVYLVDAADGPAVAAVHGEVFGEIRPASGFIVVAGFLDPRWRVEVEADAIVAAPD